MSIMARQMLLYDRVVPLSTQRHATWSLQALQRYDFARGINSVPLMATEIITAAREYCVVFARQGDVVMPAAVLGVRDGENTYVEADGGWRAGYVPAFIRRYPFVVASRDDGKTFTLCIDEDFGGWNQEGRGEALFGDDGKETEYLSKVVDFVKQYQLEFQRTKAVCDRLVELGLFEGTRVQMRAPDGQEANLGGFLAVSRDKLKALEPAVLAELAKGDLLELIYAHLSSLRNFQDLASRTLVAAPAEGASALDGPPAGTA
ncbi:MAG: SapC family protein [Pseudomonadota bacterium]